MKDIAILGSVYAVLFVAVICFGLFHKSDTEPRQQDLYPRTAVVVEIDRPNDTVICEDSVGMLWAFYGCDDWEVDDCVSLIMDSRGTENIKDDAIVSTRYSAWVLGR